MHRGNRALFILHDCRWVHRTYRSDRAVELGMLPPAPAEKACAFCDFLPVCGPNQERRARRKSREQLADLIELRGRP